TTRWDERSAVTPTGRREGYRYQVQGPNAMDVLARARSSPALEPRVFNMGELTIAGRTVRSLRHGMAGAPGMELFGPYEDGERVRAALVEAGEECGLRQVGTRAYSTNTLESGWIPSPLPAVFTGEQMKPYREWLPADCYEAKASIGGSFNSAGPAN